MTPAMWFVAGIGVGAALMVWTLVGLMVLDRRRRIKAMLDLIKS